ncbi:MAG TPA: Rrf2 family transcriptional regulator [Tepidisphaeraceae bacterium]|nr:Rrf2 family transcriptional regulator [Tepidisphaeraceae bacterium]
MIFSNATEYAIRGLSELAGRGVSGPVMLDELVVGTDLPRDFLAKIFQKLVRAGILKSAKGRGGGFQLARPQHEVRLIDIVEAIEGPQLLDACVVGLEKCNDNMPCAQHDLYKPIRQRLKDYLRTTTLADLAASLRSKQSWRELRQMTENPSAAVAAALTIKK